MPKQQVRIAAVVLAAGMSTRMGSNKLVADIRGEPLIRHVVRSVEASAARPIVVVTGHDRERIGAALAGTEAALVHNPAYKDGMSTSLRVGVNAVTESDGAIVLLGDMPAVSGALIDRMISAFDPANAGAICVAVHRGRRGNPVLFARRFFPELRELSGDVGARSIVGKYPDLVCEVEADNEAPLTDLDTRDDLERYLHRP